MALNEIDIDSQVQKIFKEAKADGDFSKVFRTKKLAIRSGDVFEILQQGIRKYFQFLYKDDSYLAGHLIRAFSFENDTETIVDLEAVLKSKVMFYSYTRIFEGLELGLWKKIGNVSIEKEFRPPLFRNTKDIDAKIKVSDKWYIWCGNIANRVEVGTLTEKYRLLPVASILPPYAIVRWIFTGNHGFFSPR